MKAGGIAKRVERPSINEEYYQWLLDLIGIHRKHNLYFLLIKTLHKKSFYWTVPNDDNRAFEGKNLREQFCEEEGYPYLYDDFKGDASLLEVIIGLAYRCESITVDQPDSMKMQEWFWLLLSNCGLDNFTDDNYYDRWRGQTIYDVIDKIIDRTYERNGQGGFFPLKRSKKDQRKVELWYQMSSYLVENYYTEDMFA